MRTDPIDAPHAASVAAFHALFALASLAAIAGGCDGPQKVYPNAVAPPEEKAASAVVASVAIDRSLLAAYGVLPTAMESKANPLTEEKLTLGRALYYETRLSASNEISCNTCHVLTVDGTDRLKTATGHRKQSGRRNSPTVYNAAGHFVQFWDGRAASVEDQAKGPITNPIEMAMPDERSALAALRGVPWYRARFEKAFPASGGDPITMANVVSAIGAFERKLVTPSRWDRFLGGDDAALTQKEKAGFEAFTNAGCNTCHAGVYVGGAMFQKLGLARPWPKDDDLGRYEVTKQEPDKMMFKVPSLRNVTKTAPYFHDGSVATLPEAVTLMGRHQLGKELTDGAVTSIVAFLESLAGEIPSDFIAPRAGLDAPPPAGKPGGEAHYP